MTDSVKLVKSSNSNSITNPFSNVSVRGISERKPLRNLTNQSSGSSTHSNGNTSNSMNTTQLPNSDTKNKRTRPSKVVYKYISSNFKKNSTLF